MEDIRDWVLVVALIALGVAVFVSLLVLAFAGWKTLRGLRRLRRLHDDHVPDLLAANSDRVQALNEHLSSRGGLLELALSAARLLRARRKRKKMSRLQRAREALVALRP